MSVFKNMLFSKAGKMRGGGFLLPLLLILLSGCCKHFEFDTTPLNLPVYSGFVYSLSSGYITVIDLEKDIVIGKEEIAIRRGGKLENVYDIMVYNNLIYGTLNERQAFEEGSDVLRVLNPSTGEVKEVKVGLAPNKIYRVGEDMAFVSTNLIYYSDGKVRHYIFDLKKGRVIDTLKFDGGLVDFAVGYGDSIILSVNQDSAGILKQFFVIYSLSDREVVWRDTTYIMPDDIAYTGMIYGDKLYVGGTNHLCIYNLPELTLEKQVYIPGNEEHYETWDIAYAHNKVYLTHYHVDGYRKIDVIDAINEEYLRSIPVPEGGALCIAYSEGVDRLYAGSGVGGKIFVIDPVEDSIIDTIETDQVSFWVIRLREAQ